ncbi:MAG: S8 family serine peptidase [Rhodothalassiaceae bacterium]
MRHRPTSDRRSCGAGARHRVRRLLILFGCCALGLLFPFETVLRSPASGTAGPLAAPFALVPTATAGPGGEDKVEDEIEDELEDELEDEIEDRVEDDLEDALEDEIEDRVEDDLEDALEDDLEDRVEDKVAEKVEDEIEDRVEDDLEDDRSGRHGGRAENRLDDRVARDLERRRGRGEGDEERAGREARAAQGDADRHEPTEEARDGEDSASHRGRGRGRGGDDDAGRRDDERDGRGAAWQDTRTIADYAEILDDAGAPALRDDVLALIGPGEEAALESAGIAIAGRETLGGLGLVMVRLRVPPGESASETRRRAAASLGGARVDLNHLYHLAAEPGSSPPSASGAGWTVAAAAPAIGLVARPHAPVRIGVIDTGIATDHPCLSGVPIVSKEFLAFTDAAPPTHGTAVASILAANPDCGLRGLLERPPLLAASVFFRTPGGRVAASAESLIAALDWLVAAGARIVNVSLAGPSNRLLEEAVDRARAHGLLLVAAVGNEGPAAPPRYPAAYPSTIAVTAVDAHLDPYVRAGRGSHVDFAAPGVEIVVAGPDGPAIESGTSIAAPFVTALLAVHAGSISARRDTRRLVLDLAASAQDLGPPGFDPVFGHGLVRAPLGGTRAAGKGLR